MPAPLPLNTSATYVVIDADSLSRGSVGKGPFAAGDRVRVVEGYTSPDEDGDVRAHTEGGSHHFIAAACLALADEAPAPAAGTPESYLDAARTIASGFGAERASAVTLLRVALRIAEAAS